MKTVTVTLTTDAAERAFEELVQQHTEIVVHDDNIEEPDEEMLSFIDEADRQISEGHYYSLDQALAIVRASRKAAA